MENAKIPNTLTGFRDAFTTSIPKTAINIALFYMAGLVVNLVALLAGLLTLSYLQVLVINGIGTAFLVLIALAIYWIWPRHPVTEKGVSGK